MDRSPLVPGPNEVVVAATEFAKNFGYYRDRAMAGKLVKVTSHGRIVGAFLSPAMLEEFEKMRVLKRQLLQVGDLPEGIVEAIRKAEYGVAPK